MNYDVFISYNSKDKHIADAVCHYIEARKMRCFIAPRDITSSDWAGCITAAIETAKAFVVIVSEHSIFSNEVAKEITLATRVSNFIFPFRIDKSELDGRMTYHLSAFHWIDAIDPPMEQKINDLVDRIEAALHGEVSESKATIFASQNRQRYCLLGQSVTPRSEFIGRTRELEEINELYRQGVNNVFLCGMGGIGKSEIAKAYAKNHSEQYTTVVFATYETDLLHLITDDQCIAVENLVQASATGGQGETLEAYYERKIKILRSIVNEHTLLIIDNFDVEQDENLEEVLSLPCHILITTRTDFSVYGYETVKVGPMDDFEDLVKLFTKIDRSYAALEEQQAIREIIKLLDCHTYAVSLTAAQIKASHISPIKMLEKLKAEGLHIQTRSGFVRKAGGQKATAYEYMQALFDFSALDESACQIMRYLSCMPRNGIDINLFMVCAEIEDYGDISHLAELNWVQIDEENDRVGLHMLVRELLKERLTPDLQNCETLLRHAYIHANNAWNKMSEENDSHNDLIFSLLETFTQPTIELLDYFEKYATFAWIQGRFDLAEKCEHKLYSLCVDHYGETSVQAGNQALRVAAVYHNQGDYAGASPWYEKGLKVQESICKESLDAHHARAKVARSYAQIGEYETASEMFLYNLEILERYVAGLTPEEKTTDHFRKVQIWLAFARMNVAQIYCFDKRCEEALKLAQAANDYLITETIEPSLVSYSLLVLMYVYVAMEEYGHALEYAQASLDKTEYYRGGKSIDIALLREIKGDLYCMQKEYVRGTNEYALALGFREKMFPSDVKAIERLEEKYAKASAEDIKEISIMNMWT